MLDRRSFLFAAAATTAFVAVEPSGAFDWPAGRRKFTWPFADTTIWNVAIGSLAQYRPLRFQPTQFVGTDDELVFQIKSSDPVRQIYFPAEFGQGRCRSTRNATELRVGFPDAIVIPDATRDDSPNNCASLVLPDGRTIVQLNVMARCRSGGPVFGIPYDTVVIKGDGNLGGHGGSGLACFGGSIRLGELTGSEPIHHAIKINIEAAKYLSFSRGPGGGPGYRWPAVKADSYANPSTYGGKISGLMMGSLLAIPPSTTASGLGLETPVGVKLLQALQDYGAYIVDDTYFDAVAFCCEKGVESEVRNTYGINLDANVWDGGPWYRDAMRLFQALNLVANNRQLNVGGGGVRRRPPPPPFID